VSERKGIVSGRRRDVPFIVFIVRSSRHREDLCAFGEEYIAAARNNFGRVAAR